MTERWRIRNIPYGALRERWGISPILAKLIANRTSPEEAGAFLQKDAALPDPYRMLDMRKCVDVILRHIDAHDRIDICGDYDVDGLTSLTILGKAFRLCGADAFLHVPDRCEDGYGLRCRTVEECARQGSRLILTCDNGIAEREAAKRAAELGIDFVVTDHHDIPVENGEELLPQACAVVDLKRKGETAAFRGLCGAGVSYQLARALLAHYGLEEPEELIGYAALGTVCDVMELVGDNRTIVQKGLAAWNRKSPVFIEMLMRQAGIEKLSVMAFGYQIGPMLNSGGRLENQTPYLELLMEEDPIRAMEGAAHLYALNRQRQEMTAAGLVKAEAMLADYAADRVLVLHLPDLHESLAGLVAGKIKERYFRPTLVVTGRNEECKGSARSIPAYSMYEEMCRASDCFIKFGGHPMAAGFSMDEAKIDVLRRRLNEQTALTEQDLEPVVMIDMQLPLRYANEELLGILNVLEPYGNGNPRPLFAVRGIHLVRAFWVGRGRKAMRLLLEEDGQPYRVMLFRPEQLQECAIEEGGEELWQKVARESLLPRPLRLDMAYQVSCRTYRGVEELQITAEHLRLSRTDAVNAANGIVK